MEPRDTPDIFGHQISEEVEKQADQNKFSGKNLKYGPEDKLQVEVEKLAEEVKVLKKPYLQPTFWIGFIALTVSLAGNIGQALTYESRAIIAKADVAQANLERMDVEAKRDDAKQELNSLTTEMASIKEVIVNVRESSDSEEVRDVLDKVEQKVGDLADSTQKTAERFARPSSTSRSAQQTTVRTTPVKKRETSVTTPTPASKDTSKDFGNVESGKAGSGNVFVFRHAKRPRPSPTPKRRVIRRANANN